MLRDRLIAASVGLPLFFILLWLNWFLRLHGNQDDLPLLAIVVILAGFSGWEISSIVQRRFPSASLANGMYAALLIPFIVHAVRYAELPSGTIYTHSLGLAIDSVGATVMLMLLFLGVWADVEQRGKIGIQENIVTLIGAGYVGATLSCLIWLGLNPAHEYAVALALITVFGTDTAAFFFGKYLGGAPLIPSISPKKTVSGAICGLLASIILAIVFQFLPAPSNITTFQEQGITLWQIALIGAAIGIAGEFGDIAESAFKRWGGVKDSGQILPGHGGFLDRFDSLFLSAPVYLFLLMNFLRK